MRLYLVRHGESEGNKRRLIFGSADFPLTCLGQRQAAEAGEKMREISISHCYSSTLMRAAETARICLSGRDVPITYHDELREQHMGEFEEGGFQELTERYPDSFPAMMANWVENPPLGGESFREVFRRVTGFVQEVLERGEDAMIVAHNGPLSMLAVWLMDAPMECVENFYFLHGCYTSFIIKKNRRNVLEFFNK